MKRKTFERAIRALLEAPMSPEAARKGKTPPAPTKKDLERKFSMRLGRRGRLVMREHPSKRAKGEDED